MGRPKGVKNKKSKFDDLSPEFKSSIDGASKEDLQSKLAEVAKNLELNSAAQKADPDLAAKKQAVKDAGAGYAEAKKAQRLKAEYLIVALSDKGDDFCEQLVRLSLQAEAQKA